MTAHLRQLAMTLCLCIAVTGVTYTQNPGPAVETSVASQGSSDGSAQGNPQSAPALSLQIEPQQVKFTVQRAVVAWRFEVKNQNGELIFDSGSVNEAELLWKLQDGNGSSLTSGLYNYTLTIQEKAEEAAKVQRGHFIIERADDRTADRVWLTTQDSQGVSVSGAQVTAARDGRELVAGVRDEPQRGRAGVRKVAEEATKTVGKKTPLEKDAISSTSTGTAGRIAKWLTTQDLGDSIIQEVSGNIGIGTATPGAMLDVAGTINAGVQYNLGGNRILSNPGNENLFVGRDAGAANTTGRENTFSGYQAGAFNITGKSNTFTGAFAGRYNTTGYNNTFSGTYAGYSNTTGDANVFSGTYAGYANTTGYSNTFNGHSAGYSNTTGYYNTFNGYAAGLSNRTGYNNTFSGFYAGYTNTTGTANTFSGIYAGYTNRTGNHNTMIGYVANVGVENLTNATAIGSEARVDCSNCLVLGSKPSSIGPSPKVGIGTTWPLYPLHVAGSGFVETRLQSSSERTILALDSSIGGSRRIWSIENGLFGAPGRFGIFDATAGAARLTIDTAGCIRHGNGTVIAGACSSDARFKRQITPFTNVLNKLTALRPVQYYWRTSEFPQQHFGSEQSYGLIAQEVEEVLPELVTTDEQGYKRVDYSRLPLLTIQAMKEQQSQVAELQKQNSSLRQQNTSQQQTLQQQQQLLTALRQRLETVERTLIRKKRNQ